MKSPRFFHSLFFNYILKKKKPQVTEKKKGGGGVTDTLLVRRDCFVIMDDDCSLLKNRDDDFLYPINILNSVLYILHLMQFIFPNEFSIKIYFLKCTRGVAYLSRSLLSKGGKKNSKKYYQYFSPNLSGLQIFLNVDQISLK